MSEDNIVASCGPIRRVIETHTEIIILGHCNAGGDYPEERFSKSGHYIEEIGERTYIKKKEK